ncbi:anti-sigma factor antagonist [Saccharothrix yanglingensis]|uniref:Anti-sigma factor antagonist n=1 Tax=Saccharothrix yanglingensis TaxID=659496 RepID=A0ABU0WUZ8_9PSEU|nr:anti-sigma factor antagonist [Saccharothrix yanglingensis]MDQ2583670.1 anti-anti-sigma factor [Saccharothrix yanglingensis]
MFDAHPLASPTVRTLEHDDIPVVVVAGEIDASTAHPVRVRLNDVLDRHPSGLVVDLSDVGFFGSTGLQLLLGAVLRARRLRTELALVANRRAVLRPLEITDLHHEVAVHPTVEQAVAAVRTRLDRTAAQPSRRRRRSW